MADAGLNVIIGADVSGAVSGFAKGKAAAADFGASVTTASNTASKSLDGLEDNIGSLTQRLNALKDLRVDIIDPDKLARVNQAIDTTAAGIERLKNVGKAGFDEFGEAIQSVDSKSGAFLGTLQKERIAFIDVGRAITDQGFSLRTVAQNFTLFNPILVVAAAGVGLLVKALIDVAAQEKITEKTTKDFQALFQKPLPLNIDIKEAQAAIDQYNKFVKDSVDATSKEASQVDILVSRIQAGNLTRNQTVDAIKKLQQIAPDYFSKLDAERTSVEQVTEAYGKYNQAIIQSIEAQIKIAELNDVVKQRLTASQTNPQATKFINDQLAAGKSLSDIEKLITQNISDQNKQFIAAGQANKVISDEMAKQILASGNIPAGTEVLLTFLQKEKDILDSINNAPLKDIGITQKSVDTAKDELQQLEQIVKLQEELEKNSDKPLFKKTELSLQLQDSGSAQFKVLQDQISDAILKGQEIGTANSAKYAQQIADLYKQILQKEIADVAVHINFDLVDPSSGGNLEKEQQKIVESIQKHLSDLQEIKVKVPISFQSEVKEDAESGNFSKAYIKAEEELLQKQITDATANLPPVPWNAKIKAQLILEQIKKDDLKDLNEELTKEFQAVSEGLIETISDAIGNALVKGGKNPFKALLDFLGTSLQSIGKDLISYSIVLDTIQSALDSLNPAVALAAGIAAEVLGSFIKAEVSRGLSGSGFAEGGVVDGPGTQTSDSIPAMLSRGEYVVRAAAVQQPGVKGLLDNLNSGTLASAFIRPAYSSGGLVSGFDSAVSFPLQSLNSQSGNVQYAGSMVNVAGDFKLRGPDLLLSISRATKNQNLV